MSFLTDAITGAEGRTVTLENPGDMGSVFTGGSTYSGKSVSIEGSLCLVPVLSSVVLISGSVAGMPLVVYRRDGEAKYRDPDHRSAAMLHSSPNPEIAADEFWEIVIAHLLLWGNGFVAKIRDSLGIVRELWPISPKRVQVTRDSAKRRVFVIDGEGPWTEQDILHFRGLSSDGLIGYSPIQLARQALGNMAAQEEFQGKFLGADGRPSVVLRHPNKISPEAGERLRASWEKVKSGGTALVEEGIEVEKWTMPLADAEFIEQMQFSDLRVAQMFNLPPGKIGAKTGDSLTYSTNEMNSIDLVTYTFGRWAKRVEKSIGRDPSIIPRASGRAPDHFVEFLVDGLMRTDVKGRYQAYAIARKIGLLTIDEIRAMENRPPLKDDPSDPPPQDPENKET